MLRSSSYTAQGFELALKFLVSVGMAHQNTRLLSAGLSKGVQVSDWQIEFRSDFYIKHQERLNKVLGNTSIRYKYKGPREFGYITRQSFLEAIDRLGEEMGITQHIGQLYFENERVGEVHDGPVGVGCGSTLFLTKLEIFRLAKVIRKEMKIEDDDMSGINSISSLSERRRDEIVSLAKACQRLMKVKKDVRSGMEFGVQLFEGYVPTFEAFVSDEIMLYSIRTAFGLDLKIFNADLNASLIAGFKNEVTVKYFSPYPDMQEKEREICRKAGLAHIKNTGSGLEWVIYPNGTEVPEEIRNLRDLRSGFNLYRYQVQQIYDQAKEVLGDESTGIEASGSIV